MQRSEHLQWVPPVASSMPIETICQGCGERLRVADEFVGRTAQCPQCRTRYTVPYPETASAQPHPPRATNSNEGAKFATPLPSLLPDDLFYVKSDGRSFGPISRDELWAWHLDGRLSSDALIQREGTSPVRAATLFAPETPSAADGATPYSVADSFPHRHQGGLVLALGLASLGSFCSCAVVMPMLAIVTFVVGAIELQRMRSGRSDPQGWKMVIAGMVLAAASVLVFAGYLALIFS